MRLKSEGTAKHHEFPCQCSVLVPRQCAVIITVYCCVTVLDGTCSIQDSNATRINRDVGNNLRSYYWHIFEVVDALPHTSWKHDTWQLCTMEVGKFKTLKFDTKFWLQTCALGRQPIPLAFQNKKKKVKRECCTLFLWSCLHTAVSVGKEQANGVAMHPLPEYQNWLNHD